MPSLVAVQRNATAARLLLASSQGGALVWRQAANIVGKDADDLTANIVSQLDRWGPGKATMVAAIGREKCELRVLTVPPVPADELPDIVRFQSLQQFSSFGDDWPLDFLPLTEQESPHVLAATTQPKNIVELQSLSEAAGIPLTGIVLQSCGTASVVDALAKPNWGACRLIVDATGNKAELIVAHQRSTWVSRSLQLNQSDDHGISTLAVEIRRTLASFSTQRPDVTIGQIVICGAGPAQQQMAKSLVTELDLPVECVDPLAACDLAGLRDDDLPDHPASFGPLIGLLLNELGTESSAIDFLRPRRPPVPTDNRKLWTTIMVAALVVAVLMGWGVWWSLRRKDAALEQLAKEIRETEELVQTAQRDQSRLDALNDWYLKSPNWLFELRRLSDRLPPPNQLRVDRLQADILSQGGGRIVVNGLVDDSKTVTELEQKLRDSQHRVEGIDRNYLGDDPDYPWYFTERIEISVDGDASVLELDDQPQSSDSDPTTSGPTERAGAPS